MYNRFGYPGLFAAYNAGPGRYAEHLAGGRGLPRETRDYLAKVAETPALPVRSADRHVPATLFAVIRDRTDRARPVTVIGNRSSLFITLSKP